MIGSFLEMKSIYNLLALVDLQLEFNRQSGPLLALGALLKCLNIAKTHSMQLVLHNAYVRFAQIMLHLGFNSQALKMLRESLPFIISNGDAYTQGLAMFVYAQIVFLFERSNEALKYLGDARASFGLIQSVYMIRKTLRLSALILNSQGRIAERNEMAFELRHLRLDRGTLWDNLVD